MIKTSPVLIDVLHKGYDDIVKLLLKYNANPNPNPNPNLKCRECHQQAPLNVAIINYKKFKDIYGIIEMLLISGADPNIAASTWGDRTQNKKTALHCAVETENKDLIALLLKYNAKLNIQDSNKETPVSLAISKNNKSLISLFKEVEYFHDKNEKKIYEISHDEEGKNKMSMIIIY